MSYVQITRNLIILVVLIIRGASIGDVSKEFFKLIWNPRLQ